MPIDPSIALGIKPVEVPNMLQTALQAQQYQNTQAQNALYQQALKGNQFDLKVRQLGWMRQQLAGLAADPNSTPDDVKATVYEGVRTGMLDPNSAQTILTAPGFPQSQSDMRPWSMRALSSVMSAEQQLGQMTPGGGSVDTGRQTIMTNTHAPALSGVQLGAPVAMYQNQLAPGQMESIEKDAMGNDHVVSRAPSGAIVATRPMPGSAPLGTPGAFQTATPGQAQDVESFRKEGEATRAAADQAPTQANINQQILRLSKNTTTGPGTAAWKTALGAMSAPWGGAENVNNYQELGKYLEKNAINAMQSMGGSPSDARLSAAMAANGSTQFNAGALQDVTKFNDAANSALTMYRQGMAQSVGLRNSDWLAMPQFKAAWAKNLDVNIFRLQNAMRDGDQAEIQTIKKELGPNGLKSLSQKWINLQTLATTGRLPQ